MTELQAGIRRWALALAVVAAFTGCTKDEGDPHAEETLEAQRTAVRAIATETAPALAAALGGTVRFLRGEWSGCSSADQWTHRNFRYGVGGRIDAADLTKESLTALTDALAEEGFAVDGDVVDEGNRVLGQGNREGVIGSVTVYPADGFVLVGFSGDCIDVPEDDREEWDERTDPEPDLSVSQAAR